MKFSINRTAIAMATAISFAGLGGCGGDSSGQADAGISVSGRIVNAASGANVQYASIRISGSDQLQLLDSSGKPVSSVSTNSGTITLQLKPGVTPSAANPIEFDITVSADGMLPLVHHVKLENVSSSPFELRMLSSQTDASGQLIGLGTLAAGTVTETLYSSGSGIYATKAVYTPTSGSSAAKVEAEVKLPQNAGPGRLVNGGFTAAAPGELNVQIITLDPRASGADKLLPQFAVANTAGPTFVAATGMLAFARVNVFDQAGNPVNRFQSPISITLELPAGSINAKTGKPFAVGDKVDIVTFDESSSTWVAHQMNGQAVTGSVTGFNAATGNAKFEFQTDHLSDYGTPDGNVMIATSTWAINDPATCSAEQAPAETLQSVNVNITQNGNPVISGAGGKDANSVFLANFYVTPPGSSAYQASGSYQLAQYNPNTGQTTTVNKELPSQTVVSDSNGKLLVQWQIPVACLAATGSGTPL